MGRIRSAVSVRHRITISMQLDRMELLRRLVCSEYTVDLCEIANVQYERG